MRFRGMRQHPVASAVAMGAGAAGVAPCPAPPRCVTGKRNREKGIRMVADGWGPLGSETRREVGGRRAGWLCWAERDRWAAA
jgi:hypothetical protein